jgi:hypothetical protein
VVETIRLESGHTLTGIVGSNPTLSAIFSNLSSVPLPVPLIANLATFEVAQSIWSVTTSP